jgi:cytochrome c1
MDGGVAPPSQEKALMNFLESLGVVPAFLVILFLLVLAILWFVLPYSRPSEH